jgi:uncharacterized protein YkwD
MRICDVKTTIRTTVGQVRSLTEITAYSSNTKIIMPINLVGRSLNRATSIANNQTILDQVSTKNRTDLFRFDLTGIQRLNLKFKSKGNGAEISLIRDQNQNGLVDTDEILKRSKMRSQRDGSIDFSNASTGTYFVQVTKSGQGINSYRFSLSTTPTTTSNAATNPSGVTPTSSSSAVIDQIVSLTNAFRQQNGLAPLTLNNSLTTAAQTHSQNMALQDFVSHTGKDGSSVAERVTATGYDWSVVAENVAAGYPTAADVVQGWINSPGHRENLLNTSVTQIGVGYYFLANDTGNANYNSYWTQVFAA